MSRILVVWNSNNRVEHRDCDGVQKALEDQGHYVEQIRMSHMYKKYDEVNINSFDCIMFKPWFNAQFGSGGNAWKLSERLRDEFKGKIFVFYCDIKMKFTPLILKYTESGYEKKNFFDGMNAKMLYSLHKSVLDDEEAMSAIMERTKEFDMPIIPFEWNFFTFSLYDELQSLVDFHQPLVYNSIYWGQFKKKVRDSLRLMEFGKINDISVGPIAKHFGESLQILPEKDGTTIPFEEYVPKAKYVLVPFEDIKGKYQFTLRFVEALALKNSIATIVFDPRVSDYLQQFSDVNNVRNRYHEVLNEFDKLLIM